MNAWTDYFITTLNRAIREFDRLSKVLGSPNGYRNYCRENYSNNKLKHLGIPMRRNVMIKKVRKHGRTVSSQMVTDEILI